MVTLFLDRIFQQAPPIRLHEMQQLSLEVKITDIYIYIYRKAYLYVLVIITVDRTTTSQDESLGEF
jgi:hypothetical protein